MPRDGRRFKDIEDARRSIAAFNETVYNTERLHSALGDSGDSAFNSSAAAVAPDATTRPARN